MQEQGLFEEIWQWLQQHLPAPVAGLPPWLQIAIALGILLIGALVALANLLSEEGHFFRLRADRTAEAERISDDEFLYVVLLDDAVELGEVGAAVLAADGRQPLGGDAERIGDSKAKRPGADVEGEDTGFHAEDYRGWYT